MAGTGKIFIAGRAGMVGKALERSLIDAGRTDLIGLSSRELDLRNGAAVRAYFAHERPECVILAAAKVGGIQENISHPVEFLETNLAIQNNVISAAHESGVDRLIFLASSAVYPKDALQPVREDSLLTGALDAANEAYALAKICGIRLCQAYARQHGRRFFSVVPTNLYGSDAHGLHGKAAGSQVIASLLTRLHEAKTEGRSECQVWGTGNALREFLHVRDFAAAILILLEKQSPPGLVNIGSGVEITIRALAEKIAGLVGYQGRLVFDASRPEGVARKVLDGAAMRDMGWSPRITLDQGIAELYRSLLDGQKAGPGPGA